MLILIVFALFGAAIMRMARADRDHGGMSSDTTVVTSGSADTTSTGKPVDGGMNTGNESTGDESTGKPGGETPSGEENLPEIRPVTGDSTF